MSILLLILKIIGIVLLSAIIIFLALLLLVLFVPIRYRIFVDKPENEDLCAKLKITWLLHFININVRYTDDLYYRVRVLFFSIKKSDNLKKNKDKSEDSANAQGGENTDSLENIQETESKASETNMMPGSNKISEYSHPLENKGEIKSSEVFERVRNYDSADVFETSHRIENVDSADDTQITVETLEDLDNNIDIENDNEPDEDSSLLKKVRIVIENLVDFCINIKDRIKAIYNKIADIISDIDYYIDAINDEKNKATIKLCYEQLSKVLKNIKPKVIKGRAHIGLDDAYSMGQMCAVYGVLFPLIHDKIQLIPDYDREVIEGNLYIKGRVTGFVVICALVKIYFNRDFKRMMNIFSKKS